MRGRTAKSGSETVWHGLSKNGVPPAEFRWTVGRLSSKIQFLPPIRSLVELKHRKSPEAMGAEQVARLFEDTVLQINMLNGTNELWWLTWISTYDRFRSRLLDRLAEGFGLPVKTPIPGRWPDYLALAKTAARALRQLHAARKARAKPANDRDLILVSILNTRKLAQTDDYIDEYFGKLPVWMVERGRRPLIVGFNEGDDYASAAMAATPRPFPIETFFQYLNLADIAYSLAKAMTCRFRPLLPDNTRPSVVNRAILDEIRHQRPAILEGILIGRAMARILARNPGASVVHMFENNAWERACYLAARKASPPRSVIGYLHCAILQSHRKYRFPVEERGIRPMPDRIVTTGPMAASALATIGDYPPGMIMVDGVALRDQVSGQDPAPVGRTGKNVLLLLEGLPSIASMLDIAGEAAQLEPRYSFTLRCHPQMPYERAIRLMKDPAVAQVWLKPNTADSLVDAISGADIVVYSSSTAVFSALGAGKPLVFIPTDTYFNNDALFYADGIALRAETPAELVRALQEIDDVSSEKQREMAEAGQAFGRMVMKAATPDCVDLFLP